MTGGKRVERWKALHTGAHVEIGVYLPPFPLFHPVLGRQPGLGAVLLELFFFFLVLADLVALVYVTVAVSRETLLGLATWAKSACGTSVLK
jgi:hypothetical protein